MHVSPTFSPESLHFQLRQLDSIRLMRSIQTLYPIRASCATQVGCKKGGGLMNMPVGVRCVIVCMAMAFWGVGSAAQAANIFLEAGGQVVAEAEHYSAIVPDPAATHAWELIAGAAGSFSNARGDYMQVLPNAELNNNVNDPFGSFLSTSPLLNYVARVSSPGDYRLYLRWGGDSGANDSIYASIVELRDGQGGAGRLVPL